MTRLGFVGLVKHVTYCTLMLFAPTLGVRNTCAALDTPKPADISYTMDTVNVALPVLTATKELIGLLELKRLFQK